MGIMHWTLAFGMFASTVLSSPSRFRQMLTLKPDLCCILASRSFLYLTSTTMTVSYPALVETSRNRSNGETYCPRCRTKSIFTKAYTNCDKCVAEVARNVEESKRKKEERELNKRMQKDIEKKQAMAKKKWEEEKANIASDTMSRARQRKM